MGKKSDESRDKKAKKLNKSQAGKKEKKSGKTKGDKPGKPSKKDSGESKKTTPKAVPISPEKRLEMIATAAYYIAERHGFTPGREASDWQMAERQINAMLSGDG